MDTKNNNAYDWSFKGIINAIIDFALGQKIHYKELAKYDILEYEVIDIDTRVTYNNTSGELVSTTFVGYCNTFKSLVYSESDLYLNMQTVTKRNVTYIFSNILTAETYYCNSIYKALKESEQDNIYTIEKVSNFL